MAGDWFGARWWLGSASGLQLPWVPAVVLVASSAVLLLAACSSGASASGDPWSASYAESDARVWEAIHQSLDALEYLVDEEDRGDGRICAAQDSERPYESVVLRIDLVRKDEVVHVYVRPSGGNAGPIADHHGRDRAVREFLGELDRRLESSALR